MNKLPDDVLYIIYKYKHQLEYKHVIDQLKYFRIKCFFNIDFSNHCILFISCLDINNICAPPKRILNSIKYNNIKNK